MAYLFEKVLVFDESEEGRSTWKEFSVFSFILFLALSFFTELKGLFGTFEADPLKFGVSLPNKSLRILSSVMLALLHNASLSM